MRCRPALFVFLTLAGAACADSVPPAAITTAPATSVVATSSRVAARERLAQAIARALADPVTRAAVKHRLDTSNAPEGKLQLQALMHTDQAALLLQVARAAAITPADLLADLDASRNLEIYLPVPAQRAAWTGDANYLVATLEQDGTQPVGYDASGARHILDARTPPSVPVIAVVPQETDFTRGHPEQMLACVDMCGGDGGGGDGDGGGTITHGGGGAYSSAPPTVVPGLYLTQSHFEGSYESWLKGSPEYEYHVYGLGDSGETVQLACAGENAQGAYYYNQDDADWTGSALLYSDDDYNAYQGRHPGAPIRIVAWEDDDESCIDHADATSVSELVTAVDNAYQTVTSGLMDPTIVRGLKAAPSIFSILTALHNIILTNDDFIGNAVAGTVTHDAPDGSNWVLKSGGTTTTGWFTTQHMP